MDHRQPEELPYEHTLPVIKPAPREYYAVNSEKFRYVRPSSEFPDKESSDPE